MTILSLGRDPAYGVLSQGDLVLEDVHEVARGLPRAYFLIRKEPNAPPLADDQGFYPCAALLDTGASASSIIEEAATRLGLTVEPHARFWDTGVAVAGNRPPFDKVVIDLARLQVGLKPKETQVQ